MDNDPRQRRAFPRASVPLNVHSPDLDGVPQMSTRDISTGGVFLYTPAPLALGHRLRLQLGHDDITLEVEGEVVHALPGFGIGVAFLIADDHWAETLEAFLRAVEARLAA